MVKVDIRDFPVLYINSDSDVESKDRMEEMLARLGFKDIKRIPAINIPIEESDSEQVRYEKNIIAHGLSHRVAIDEAIQLQQPFTLLEDNCYDLEAFNPIIEVPETTEAIYLGYSNHGIASLSLNMRDYEESIAAFYKKQTVPGFHKVKNTTATHAITYLTFSTAENAARVAELGIRMFRPYSLYVAATLDLFNVLAPETPMFAIDEATEMSVAEINDRGAEWNTYEAPLDMEDASEQSKK